MLNFEMLTTNKLNFIVTKYARISSYSDER